MRHFLEFSYNGKAYCGWQSQPNALGVQQVIEQALSLLLKQPIAIVGAGRTDSGVHALQMFAHFDAHQIPENLVQKLNSFLPKDISIFNIHPVKNDAHARFDATQRGYKYYINQKKNPFSYDFSYFFPAELDVDLMNNACEILQKYSDFQCFSKTKTDVKTYFCEIFYAHWEQKENELIFHIRANRFLRNMVRAIVGTMLQIGQKKLSLEGFEQVIRSKNRSRAGFSVPGHALFLTEVLYPKDIFLEKTTLPSK